MNIYIESHGCSRRKLDVAKFHRYFPLNGYSIVTDPEKADEILITTCAFKYDEEEESLLAIEKLSKFKARITVYGCLPAIAPAKYNTKFSYSIITPKDINSIDDHYKQITHKFASLEDENVIRDDINYSSLSDAVEKFTSDFELSVPFFLKSYRYIKNKYLSSDQIYYISSSRGCLGHCSYCGVRFAVGTLVSKPIDTIVMEFARGVQSKYMTYSVTGDDVGAYGQDCGSNFCILLSTLLEEIEKIPSRAAREKTGLVFEEINPRWILRYEDELTTLFYNKYVKSILCPIQSGSTRILGLMNRNDDIGKLMEILNKIKANNSNIELNTQIIVGFPTETEAEFDESLAQISNVVFDTVTLFPYDDKENTISSGIYPKVTESVKQERIKKAQKYLGQKGFKTSLSCNEKN